MGPCRGRVGAVSGSCRGRVGAVSGPCRGRVGAVSGPCRGRIGAIYNIFPDFGSLGFWILGGLCMRSFYSGCTIWKLEFACDTRF